jgi:hypothetical protein
MTQTYLHFLGNSLSLLKLRMLKNCKAKKYLKWKGIGIVYGESNLKIACR